MTDGERDALVAEMLRVLKSVQQYPGIRDYIGTLLYRAIVSAVDEAEAALSKAEPLP